MHRESLLKDLAEYKLLYPDESYVVQKFTQFVEITSDCFERTHGPGHITGSAFVVSADRNCILLALHAKLQKWLQLGGHADGCPYVHDVALREAVEESGISNLLPYLNPQVPIDVDIHEIPSNKKDGVHLHYDVRYVFHSLEDEFICSNESLALKWIPIDEISIYCKEPSTLRVIKKIKNFI
jgi:8-oxo-dGTP pyrophosphatase MutT (NUDIX family)